jgi:hypothetical protein
MAVKEDTLLWAFTFAPTADPQRILCIMSNRTHYLWTHCKPGAEYICMQAMLHKADEA